ncbi:FAD-dependent oxidoreductase [Shimia sp. CNT1-13L.2]|uniref:NAD(P)/FAD-dependent oxidoreductase n=1 Tax=Shimia sp. CNT1-13L.2 TaxID=2959663 RepID=UPI0020CD6AF6|nr:FAD-dependent oxidoreductase [Shimia sp. CNT1-13L.2]MCP9484041.1 FAD-dependent oxidoreductase [Shimia sp. CNT1-13L.2]
MSFDAAPPSPQRIAVIGGGISGLSAAYELTPGASVTLFESEDRLGGHAHTVLAGRNGDVPVDMGFIVFNYANYPHLTRMFRDLEVPVVRSNMSFGATIDDGRVEYGLQSAGALVGQKRNLGRPGFYRMVRDIFAFNARAEDAAATDEVSVGDLMKELGLGDWFKEYYLMPICGAIWSTPPNGIEAFPARSLVRFFRNHALLSATGQHQWWTVDGGSIEYVKRLERHLRGLGVVIHTGTPVQGVTRDESGVEVSFDGRSERFDQVIFACHSDVALRLISDPTPAETSALGDVRYQDNEVILHCDPTQMPRRKACWASWVYKADTRFPQTAIGVTYWMNRLQNLPEDDLLLVTLNPAQPIAKNKIYETRVFRHPVFDKAALDAQERIKTMQGQNRTWFAGAWLRHGFHEDGYASAMRVVRQMGLQFEGQPA